MSKVKLLIQTIVNYLVAHPAVKNFLMGAIHVVLVIVGGYVMNFLQPGNTTAISLSTLGLSLVAALHAYLQNQHDAILAFLQDQLQALAGSVPGNPAPTGSSALTPLVVPPVTPATPKQ
jgi:hypothetical protein